MFRLGKALQRSGSNMGRFRFIVMLLLVMTTAGSALATGPLLSSAMADPRYEVMNAPIGVYWRSEPNWAAAERITGFGVYDGTIIEVHCYQSGTTVEGSADTMWEQATDVGGRGYGSGWLNEHFINDGQPINQPSPGVPPCNAPPPPEEQHPAPEEHPSGGGGLVFPIFNAEGGIYYRNSPHWADTPQIPGVGVYSGDQVQLICGAFGDAVGPYNDTAWSYVNNLSRPVGEGWVNEHFINDGMLTNQFVVGEPMCGPEIPGVSGGHSEPITPPESSPVESPPQQVPLASGPQSVFYWPLLSAKDYPVGVPANGVGDVNIGYKQWTVQNSRCSLSNVGKENLSGSVNTLAGWSLSRLGPVYYLATHQGQLSQIHTIILFDPGDLEEMEPPGCDSNSNIKPSINALIVKWLYSDPTNELLVLAAQISEREGFKGLWHYYFKGVWSQPKSVRARVQVCNYHRLKHDNVIKDFYGIVKLAGRGARPNPCPIASNAPKPVPWNP